MPFTPIALTARVAMRYSQHGQERVNVYHVKNPAGWSAADLQALCVEFFGWWTGSMRSFCVDDLIFQDVTATDMSTAGGAQHVLPCSGASCPGAVTAEPEPGNVTSTISWRTARTGRKYRGRSFVPGWNINQTELDDTISNTAILQLANIAFQLISDISFGHPWQLAVASKLLQQSTPITGIKVENVLDSMRRRLPGRGR